MKIYSWVVSWCTTWYWQHSHNGPVSSFYGASFSWSEWKHYHSTYSIAGHKLARFQAMIALTYLSTVPGYLAINIAPTTNERPETTFPIMRGRLLPVRSIHKTQHASPIKAMMLLIDWKRRILVDVNPIYRLFVSRSRHETLVWACAISHCREYLKIDVFNEDLITTRA